MSRSTRVITIAVLFCIWSGTTTQKTEEGTTTQETEEGSCQRFGFAEDQVRQWGQCWPDCDGDEQSPINIETQHVVTESFPNLVGSFYTRRSEPFHFTLRNDNYTVTMELKDAKGLYLEGGPLACRYYVEHIQFCWGSNDSVGSDNTIDNVQYPMEGQWGLFSEKYPTYEEASKHPDGVLRITQLYRIVKQENPSIAPIVRALSHVTLPGETVSPEEKLTYDHIFSGYSVDDYYTYNGSFVTPPCSQDVKWLVYPSMTGVTESQVKAFRTLKSTEGPLVDNFRPVQPLNDRVVAQSDKSCRASGKCETGTPVLQRCGAAASRRHGPSRRHGSARRHH